MTKMLKILLIFVTFLRFQSAVSSSYNQTILFGYSFGGDEFSSKYKHNLHDFLESLSSQASKSGFYNISTSDQTPNKQRHGLYLCRGDVDPQTCHDCVKNANQGILKQYPYGKETLVWYDHCMVRYANKPILGKLDFTSYYAIRDERNIKGDRFRSRQIVYRTMRGLAFQAAFARLRNKFASRVVNFTKDKSLYGLVQCTPDLNPTDCHWCLTKAIANIRRMGSSLSGKVMHVNCMARYEFFPFSNSNAIKSSESPSPKATDNSSLFKIRVQVQSIHNMINSSTSKPSFPMDNSATYRLRAKIEPSPSYNHTIKAKLCLPTNMVMTNSTMIKQKGHDGDTKASE